MSSRKYVSMLTPILLIFSSSLYADTSLDYCHMTKQRPFEANPDYVVEMCAPKSLSEGGTVTVGLRTSSTKGMHVICTKGTPDEIDALKQNYHWQLRDAKDTGVMCRHLNHSDHYIYRAPADFLPRDSFRKKMNDEGVALLCADIFTPPTKRTAATLECALIPNEREAKTAKALHRIQIRFDPTKIDP